MAGSQLVPLRLDASLCIKLLQPGVCPTTAMADKKTNKRRKSHQKDPETQPETQFESHSDDSDNMYEVVRILKEDETRYFVEWAGIDPDTGKDWAPTWV